MVTIVWRQLTGSITSLRCLHTSYHTLTCKVFVWKPDLPFLCRPKQLNGLLGLPAHGNPCAFG